MAGISLAWLLDGACDVVVLEARDSIGGNVQTVDVDLDGHRLVVDLGAQYFIPVPIRSTRRCSGILVSMTLTRPAPRRIRFRRRSR